MAGTVDRLRICSWECEVELVPKYVAGTVAAALSLTVHLAVIGYCKTLAGDPRATAVSDRVLTVAFQRDASTRISPAAAPAVRGQQTRIEQHTSLAAPNDTQGEKLFPAFYSVHYYDPKELSSKPFVTLDMPHDFALAVPGVPDEAAVLLLLINEYGDVDKVVVESSRLPEEAQSVLESAVGSMRFFPGQVNGVPVKSRMKIQIRLAPEKS